MTQLPLRSPSHLLLRPKAAPTSSSTSIDALVTKSLQVSRNSSRNRQPSPVQSPSPIDVSEKATAALIRRVLVPHNHGGTTDIPIDELLPPLTSSNDVDLQLYAIIAIIIKEFVSSWYGKITPDQGFVEEVVRIIAHCTRALEQRIRSVDIEALVLDEIPEFIESHVNAYRRSHESLHPPPITTDSRAVYHALIPHPAMSPVPNSNIPSTMDEQLSNETAYRQLLVQGILAVLLPTEDLGNACLRTLVADIIGEMVLGKGISGKACEGWLIWEGITKIVENIKARVGPKATGEEIEVDTRSRLEKFGLLSEKREEAKDFVQPDRSSVFSEIFWRVLQYGYLTFVTLRFIILGLMAASSQPSRSRVTSSTSGLDVPSLKAGRSDGRRWKRPILTFKIFSLTAILFDLSDRMPWLCGSLNLVQYHVTDGLLKVGATDGYLDKFLHHLLRTHVLSPSLLPPLLHTLRTSLFPANTLAPPRPVPSSAQQREIQRSCAIAIIGLVPAYVGKRFLLGDDTRLISRGEDKFDVDKEGKGKGDEDLIGSEEEDRIQETMIQEVMERFLDVFGDSYCNRHLVYGILELVIVRLFPEMGEKRVQELMESRLGDGL